MTFDQWQQIANALAQAGMDQQTIYQLIGPPPGMGGGWQTAQSSMSGASGAMSSPAAPPAPTYNFNSYQAQPTTIDPSMLRVSPGEMLMNLLWGSKAVDLEKGLYDTQLAQAKNNMNPAYVASRINQMTRQLSPQLINSVTRAIMPGVAMRGLATSGPMTQQAIAEALAPYAQQNQQLAEQAYFTGQQAIGAPGQGPAQLLPYEYGNIGRILGQGVNSMGW